jgi:hypothetical protein
MEFLENGEVIVEHVFRAQKVGYELGGTEKILPSELNELSNIRGKGIR